MSKKKKVVLGRIDEAIDKLNNKDFTMFFFTVDSRNTPSGDITYVYQMAKSFKDLGYNVTMIYQLQNEYSKEELEKFKETGENYDTNREFIGVKEWLGEEYSSLPHLNISTEEWKISPSDFLFIPEVFSSLMFETYKHGVPCKRYVILQNFENVTKFIPLGVEWSNYGIADVIGNSDTQINLLKRVFPYVRTYRLTPKIDDMFRKPIEPSKLIVNLLVNSKDDVNRIIKQFYWMFPKYKFVSFRDLRGFPKEKYAEMLKEGCISVWVDQNTPFGYCALEAMKCGNIVIGKVPETIPEWAENDGKIKDNAIWTYDVNEIPVLIHDAVNSYLTDGDVSDIEKNVEETLSEYTSEKWDANILELADYVVKERLNEFKTVRGVADEKIKDEKEEETNE